MNFPSPIEELGKNLTNIILFSNIEFGVGKKKNWWAHGGRTPHYFFFEKMVVSKRKKMGGKWALRTKLKKIPPQVIRQAQIVVTMQKKVQIQ